LELVRALMAGGVLVVAAAAPAVAADIAGAGSSFAYPIYAKWAEAYKKETGVGVNYRAIGSADGIRQVQDKTLTFAATDMPLSAADLDAGGLVQFPMLTAGVAVVVNVDGVKPGDLTLDGPTLARILLGEIKAWNDATIRKLNPSLKLPSQRIAVIYRSDGSGSTFLFTDFLSRQSPIWRSRISDRPRRSNGRSAWAPLEARASQGVWRGPRARSAMWNTPTCGRASSAMPGW
jgi:phosphate transport system substrate-binding protein